MKLPHHIAVLLALVIKSAFLSSHSSFSIFVAAAEEYPPIATAKETRQVSQNHISSLPISMMLCCDD